ncbi:MAG: Gfo/Idh/MocA family oxidoreductase [Acetobacteraceae bacterium]|nr:Gfo/Idh/MocA family oxidoreductase [Acetobacteraceae bacterium]MCX7684879.1 Gfo/Idh/MocA family oxidoreductase [Acetobacteraceae bacterium]
MRLALGILGAGHFGRFHALKAAGGARTRLAGVHDADPARAAQVAAEAGAPAMEADALIAASDALVVAAPTAAHHALALRAISAGKPVLVEKPLAGTLAEAEEIVAAAAARGVPLQVGHIERFSAAFAAVAGVRTGGRAWHYHAVRMAPFRPRSLDVSVVLDLMIHDIDLILALEGSEPAAVSAAGRRIASGRLDQVVARLDFPSGARAEIAASRASAALERRLRVLTEEGEMAVDFLARSLTLLRKDGDEALPGMPGFGLDRLAWTDHDSLAAEQAAFADAVLDGTPVVVDGAAGLRALKVALAVEAAAEASAG